MEAEAEGRKTDEEVKGDAKEFLKQAFVSFVKAEEEKKVAEEAKRKAREDRMNGVEPTITEENGQIVKAQEPEPVIEQEPEIQEVDSLLAIKNWAMQSPDWKLLNVLIELMNKEQLQYECKNDKTVFDMIASLLRLGLTKPYSV